MAKSLRGQLDVTNWDSNYRVSEHFILYEFIKSDIALKQGMIEQYVEKPEIIENLKFLCKTVLEPIREAVKVPLVVNSGYRCKRLNTACGGVFNSMHLYGLAADLMINFNMQMFLDSLQRLNFDYIELKDRYVHIQIKEQMNMRRVVDERKIK